MELAIIRKLQSVLLRKGLIGSNRLFLVNHGLGSAFEISVDSHCNAGQHRSAKTHGFLAVHDVEVLIRQRRAQPHSQARSRTSSQFPIQGKSERRNT